MLNMARLTEKKRKLLWAKCAATVTKIKNIMTNMSEELTLYEAFYGKKAPYTKYMQTFGEIRIMTNHENKKTHGKLEDRQKPCLFLGYSDLHARGVCRMLNLRMNKVVHSHDIIWLGKNYRKYYNIKKLHQIIQEIKSDDEEEEVPVFEG